MDKSPEFIRLEELSRERNKSLLLYVDLVLYDKNIEGSKELAENLDMPEVNKRWLRGIDPDIEYRVVMAHCHSGVLQDDVYGSVSIGTLYQSPACQRLITNYMTTLEEELE